MKILLDLGIDNNPTLMPNCLFFNFIYQFRLILLRGLLIGMIFGAGKMYGQHTDSLYLLDPSQAVIELDPARDTSFRIEVGRIVLDTQCLDLSVSPNLNLEGGLVRLGFFHPEPISRLIGWRCLRKDRPLLLDIEFNANNQARNGSLILTRGKLENTSFEDVKILFQIKGTTAATPKPSDDLKLIQNGSSPRQDTKSSMIILGILTAIGILGILFWFMYSKKWKGRKPKREVKKEGGKLIDAWANYLFPDRSTSSFTLALSKGDQIIVNLAYLDVYAQKAKYLAKKRDPRWDEVSTQVKILAKKSPGILPRKKNQSRSLQTLKRFYSLNLIYSSIELSQSYFKHVPKGDILFLHSQLKNMPPERMMEDIQNPTKKLSSVLSNPVRSVKFLQNIFQLDVEKEDAGIKMTEKPVPKPEKEGNFKPIVSLKDDALSAQKVIIESKPKETIAEIASLLSKEDRLATGQTILSAVQKLITHSKEFEDLNKKFIRTVKVKKFLEGEKNDLEEKLRIEIQDKEPASKSDEIFNSEKQELEGQLKKAQKHNKDLQKTNDSYSKRITQLNQERKTSLEELQKAQSQYSKMVSQFQKILGTDSDSSDQLMRLVKQNLISLKNTTRELEKTQAEYERLSRLKEEWDQERKNLTNEIETEQQLREKKLKILSDEKTELDIQLQQHLTTIEELQETNESLSSQIANLLSSQKEQVKGLSDGFKKDENLLNQQLQQHQQSILNLKESKESLSQKLAQHEAKIADLMTQLDINQKSHLSLIAALQQTFDTKETSPEELLRLIQMKLTDLQEAEQFLNSQDQVETWKSYIEEGRIKKVLVELKSHFQENNNKDLGKECSILLQWLNRITREQNSGSLADDYYRKELSRISRSTLDLIDTIA